LRRPDRPSARGDVGPIAGRLSYWDPPPHPFFQDDEPPEETILAVMMREPVADWVAECFVPKVFQGWYDEDDSYAKRIEQHARYWAEHLGEDEARARLEFLSLHSADLTSGQRSALEGFVARVRAGEAQLGESVEAPAR
jgi:hypothetical protein